MKTLLCFFAAILSIVSFSLSHADSSASCVQQWHPAVQRQTLVWTLKWDAFDALLFPDGYAGVTGTGPVPITPFNDVFDAQFSTSNEFEVILVETYPNPGIWTLNGQGMLYKLTSIPVDPGFEMDINPPGVVQKSCSGGF